MTTNIFEGADVIHAYTRKQALQDGFQVDGNIGDFAEVTKQHFKFPVYMTRGVFEIIDKAVKSKRHCNDIKGVCTICCGCSRLRHVAVMVKPSSFG